MVQSVDAHDAVERAVAPRERLCLRPYQSGSRGRVARTCQHRGGRLDAGEEKPLGRSRWPSTLLGPTVRLPKGRAPDFGEPVAGTASNLEHC